MMRLCKHLWVLAAIAIGIYVYSVSRPNKADLDHSQQLLPEQTKHKIANVKLPIIVWDDAPTSLATICVENLKQRFVIQGELKASEPQFKINFFLTQRPDRNSIFENCIDRAIVVPVNNSDGTQSFSVLLTGSSTKRNYWLHICEHDAERPHKPTKLIAIAKVLVH